MRAVSASEAEIAAALTGHYRPEHLFVLRQNLELYDAFQRQIESCDIQIEAHLTELARKAAPRSGSATRRAISPPASSATSRTSTCARLCTTSLART